MQKRQWTPVTKIIFFGILGVGFILMAGIITIGSTSDVEDNRFDDTETITKEDYKDNWGISDHHGMSADTASTIAVDVCRARDNDHSEEDVKFAALSDYSSEDQEDVLEAVSMGNGVAEGENECA